MKHQYLSLVFVLVSPAIIATLAVNPSAVRAQASTYPLAGNFTIGSGSNCSRITTNLSKIICIAPVTFNDGKSGYLETVFPFAGSFSNQIIYFVFPDGYASNNNFSGTATPQSVSGTFGVASTITGYFSYRKGRCYRGTCQTVQYISSGFGTITN